jgi:hypothetical protein
MRRETATEVRKRPLIIELHPSYIAISEKGTHRQFSVPYDAIYDLARKLAARDAK